MESLRDTYVLLAGATGGIGRETARLISESGARIFLTGRDPQKLAELAASIGLDSRYCQAAELSDPADVERLRQRYFEVYPEIGVLVNASGIGIIRPFDTLSADELNRSLQSNLIAPFLLLKAFLPAMKERNKGLVISIPGVLGKVPMAGAAAYCASKYGLVGMLQSIREELKRTNIRITQLYLGGVDTPFWDRIDLRVQRDRMILAAEAAKAIWFLCQQPSSGVVSEMVLQPFNHQAI
ncbi:MAG: hypothetical protein RJA57_710 [Bacteroidota bacterium]|jgi:short-subunit dehydrogenase